MMFCRDSFVRPRCSTSCGSSSLSLSLVATSAAIELLLAESSAVESACVNSSMAPTSCCRCAPRLCRISRPRLSIAWATSSPTPLNSRATAPPRSAKLGIDLIELADMGRQLLDPLAERAREAASPLRDGRPRIP